MPPRSVDPDVLLNINKIGKNARQQFVLPVIPIGQELKSRYFRWGGRSKFRLSTRFSFISPLPSRFVSRRFLVAHRNGGTVRSRSSEEIRNIIKILPTKKAPDHDLTLNIVHLQRVLKNWIFSQLLKKRLKF